MQAFFKGMKNLRTPPHRFGDGTGADWHYHEFLKIDGVVGMFAAVNDVHHRHRQHMRAHAADIAVKRQTARVSCGFRNCKANPQNCVRTEVRLVGRAIEIDHHRIDIFLILGIKIDQRFGNRAIHRLYRLQHALAHITRHVAIAFFGGFVSAS